MATLLTPEVVLDLWTALGLADLPAHRWDAAQAALRAAESEVKAPPQALRWTSPRPGVHVIDGHQVDSDLAGLMAAHLAISSPWRKVVRAADIAAPGATSAGNSVRKALQVAASFIEPLSPTASAAIRLCVVTADGFVYYAPDGTVEVDAH